MSTLPANIPETADLLAQIEITARRFAETVVRPRLRLFDSTNSSQAWGEILGGLRSQGLLDPPLEPSDPSSFKLIAFILNQVGSVCPGVATGLWGHYVARAPFALADRRIEVGALLTPAFLRGNDANTAPAFGATGAAHAVVYSELEATATFKVLPLRLIAAQDRQLGLRACRFAPISIDDRTDSPMLVLDLPAGRKLLQLTESIALAWLGCIAASNSARAIREAKEYAATRYQAGGLIIHHPVILQLLGRMEMLAAASVALVEKAVTNPVEGNMAGLAKAFATRTGEEICSDAIQVLGGYGYMEDYGLEKRLRDAKTLCVIGGNNNRLAAMTAGSREG